MLNPLTSTDSFRHRLETGRLQRLRDQLQIYDCTVGLFYDPINIRYATGIMQAVNLHIGYPGGVAYVNRVVKQPDRAITVF